ncbi:MAG: polyamine aminopropyltransferase [Flavobacteriales bacterium]|nr:polyamine aminopropyltransferase [Flavobacteriales bacterium]
MRILLLVTIFLISTCGLIYELVAGTLASYLLGDSVTQFSTIIGTYLFSMGIGSYLSKFVTKNLEINFIRIELLVGLIGGLSSSILFICFGYGAYFRVILYFLVGLTGLFVGMEIPLIMRILKSQSSFKDLVSDVFTFDYIGSLLASIAFPVFLVPYLNLTRTSLLFGLMNVALALYLIHFFRHKIHKPSIAFAQGVVCALILGFAFIASDLIQRMSEEEYHGDGILFATTSKYQRIVITRDRNAYSLFLNNHLQFNSRDEYRYHEALIHPTFAHAKSIENVLIMGGGDGFAVREMLKYPEVKNITLVDLDEKMVDIFRTNPLMKKLNNNSLLSSKLKVINQDAFLFLQNRKQQKFDVIIIDFPDPSNFSIGKLYSTTFYHRLQQVMKPSTLGVVQSTSPLYAKGSFWCIDATIRETGLQTLPYHAYVPSFGEWGYVQFSILKEAPKKRKLPKDLRFYTEAEWQNMKHFQQDMLEEEPIVNRLNNQALIPLFEKEWAVLMD